MKFKDALFWKPLNGKKVKCQLCPHQCILDNGEVGKCNVRMNITGKLKVLNFNKVHEVSYSKIEDQGIYHFFPGSESVKIVIPGDNLSSEIYESVEFSDKTPVFTQTPDKFLRQIENSNAKIVHFMGEPFVTFEYMKIISEKNSIKNVFSSKGFIEVEPLRKIKDNFDVGIFEVLSMREEFYEKILNGKLSSVLDAIKEFNDSGKWIEIKMPLTKQFHYDFYDIRRLVSWILDNLNADVPLHFYSIDVDVDFLKKARKIAIDAGMNFVYLNDNNFIEGKTTFCPNCKKPVIIRGENTENLLKKGKCICGFSLPGVWQ